VSPLLRFVAVIVPSGYLFALQITALEGQLSELHRKLEESQKLFVEKQTALDALVAESTNALLVWKGVSSFSLAVVLFQNLSWARSYSRSQNQPLPHNLQLML
jgi:hypothetical protein